MNPYCLAPHEIKARAVAIRKNILTMNAGTGQGHTGADLSETDILASLYFHVLNCAPDRTDDPDRDRYIQSKGHGVGGLYCTLAEAGYLDSSELGTYLRFDSRLPGHPVRQKLAGIELNTGALGHGLPVAVGLALAAKMSKKSCRVFVLTGDGELQEGSNWEAGMSAARFELDNLVVINDRNRLQLADRTEHIMPVEPLADKWKAFGFDVHECDGHDPASLIETIEGLDLHNKKPHVIIAHTTKGKGVSFIENNPPWHHRVPNEDELAQAMKELTTQEAAL